MAPIYACGPGPAAAKPQALSSAQKDSRHRPGVTQGEAVAAGIRVQFFEEKITRLGAFRWFFERSVH